MQRKESEFDIDYTQEFILDKKRKIHGDGYRHTKKGRQNYIFVSMGFTHLLLLSKKQLFKPKMENGSCEAMIRIKKKLWFK